MIVEIPEACQAVGHKGRMPLMIEIRECIHMSHLNML